jgi:hypothetical protein
MEYDKGTITCSILHYAMKTGRHERVQYKAVSQSLQSQALSLRALNLVVVFPEGRQKIFPSQMYHLRANIYLVRLKLDELLNSCRTRFMAHIWYSQRKDFDSHRANTCQCIRTQLKHACFDNLLHEDTLLDCRGPIICSVPLPEDDGIRSI